MNRINKRGGFWHSCRDRLLLTGALVLLFLLASCANNDTTWSRIEQSGTLRIGLDPTFPPFETVEEQTVVGLDVDLAQALARELGLEADFVYFGYDGLYDALSTKQVDVLISAMIIDPGRRRDFAYSKPYFNAGEILVVPVGSEISDMTDLTGVTLAVELGAQGHVEALQWAKRLPDLAVAPYPSAAEAMEAVGKGEANAALIDGVNGRLYLRDQPALMRTANPVTVEPYALVVRIEDERLLVNLNASLDALIRSGELDHLIESWMD